MVTRMNGIRSWTQNEAKYFSPLTLYYVTKQKTPAPLPTPRACCKASDRYIEVVGPS